MARPKKDFDLEALLADWKTGRYQGRSGIYTLAKKYGIGKDKVYSLVKDVEVVNRQLTDKIVSNNQELNELSDKEFNAVLKHADRETRLKIRRDKIVNLVFDAIEERLLDVDKRNDLSTYDIKTLVEANDKNCVTAEIAQRFASGGGVTVNANAQAGVQQVDKRPVKVMFVGH